MASRSSEGLDQKDSTMVKMDDVDGLDEKDELSHWMSQLFDKLELEVDEDICSTEKMAKDALPLLEGRICPQRNSEKIRHPIGSVLRLSEEEVWQEKGPISDRYGNLRCHTYHPTDECMLGVAAGFQSSPCPRSPNRIYVVPNELYDYLDKSEMRKRVARKQPHKYAMEWVIEECLHAFKKCVEVQPHFKDIEYKFGELRHHSCNDEFSKMTFHHYNFIAAVKTKRSEIWTSGLYFAEVKQLWGTQFYFCCLLEESDDGHCYLCKSRGIHDLKHPARGGFHEGHVNSGRLSMNDDLCSSDDDY